MEPQKQISILKLYFFDMQEAIMILGKIEDPQLDSLDKLLSGSIKDYLCKYFIVAYSRPFSGNRNIDMKKHYLSSKHIPKEFRELHKTILDYRDELVAHTDYSGRNPQTLPIEDGSQASISYKFNEINYKNFLEDKENLKKLVHSHIKYLLDKTWLSKYNTQTNQNKNAPSPMEKK